MTLLGTPKLGSTDLLHVLKRELRGIVKVVQDLDIHNTNGEVRLLDTYEGAYYTKTRVERRRHTTA